MVSRFDEVPMDLSTRAIRKLAPALLLLLLVPLQGMADEDIWKSGINQYVRIAQQDESANGPTPPNQHPVSLSPQEITNALMPLEVWDKKGFFKDIFRKSEGAVTVFSPAQAALLGSNIAAGLKQAASNQDVVFALARNEKGFLHIRDTTYTAGRVFYANDRLNIIIGDFAKSPDKFQERVAQSSGIEEVKSYYAHGKRAKASGFDRAVITRPGIEVYTAGGEPRPDWLVIDVPAASAAYLAERDSEENVAAAASNAVIREEAEKLAAERRELRLEMARMRKEMKEQSGNGAGGRSVEERLATLKELYEKNLISKEEYESRRREILGEI